VDAGRVPVSALDDYMPEAMRAHGRRGRPHRQPTIL